MIRQYMADIILVAMNKKSSIKTFQDIWQKEFGEKISTEEALIQGNKLITFFKTIANYIEIKEQKNEEAKNNN